MRPVSATCLATLILACPAVPARGQENTPDRPFAGSLDAQLFEDLGELPVETDRRPIIGTPRTQQLSPEPNQVTRPLPDGRSGQGVGGADLEEWRGEDLGEAPADFGLFRIERTMRSVQQQLAGDDTSLGTQRLQEKIIADLDALLKQVQQPLLAGQSRASSQTKTGNAAGSLERAAANGPTRNGGAELGRASAAELTANDYDNLLRRVWGHLPARLRDELQTPRREHFLPKYSKLIEDYYQRLAQQPAE